MAVEYKSIVPWGRSFREYEKMFALSDLDLKLKILGCGDGPASFNAELTKRGGSVLSFDPIYHFSKAEIESRIDETFDLVVEQTKANAEKYLWTNIKTVQELGSLRRAAMKDFLKDYEQGKQEKRYIAGELPQLDAVSGPFDLALFSHFLFLYSDNLSYEFHEVSLTKVLEISSEIRVFPILDNNGNRSKYLDRIIRKFNTTNSHCFEQKVDYEFQKNGNKMLVIRRGSIGIQ